MENLKRIKPVADPALNEFVLFRFVLDQFDTDVFICSAFYFIKFIHAHDSKCEHTLNSPYIKNQNQNKKKTL